MELSRQLPARKKTIKFLWCKKEFQEMSQKFREIRSKHKNPLDKCRWCNHKFVDGEMMALACPEKGKNKMLCQACADELLSSNPEV